MCLGEDMPTLKPPNLQNKIIIQITDTHLMDQPETEFVQINPEQNFHAVIDDLLQRFPHIDALIHTGDLAQIANPETYTRYQNYMQKLGIPFFQIPGNHDDLAHFPFHTPDPIPTVIELGEWSIILLNSAVQGQTDGWIQTEQLQHLKQILEQQLDKNIILACHHHPFAMKSHWIDQHKLKNTEEFIHILEHFKHIKAVIYGHVHQDSKHVWNGISFLSTPATCVQFKPLSHNFALDDMAPGYRYLQLKENGEFETEVFRLKNFSQKIMQEISGY